MRQKESVWERGIDRRALVCSAGVMGTGGLMAMRGWGAVAGQEAPGGSVRPLGSGSHAGAAQAGGRGLVGDLELLWSYSLELFSAKAAPRIVDGVVYVTGREEGRGMLAALDLRTGVEQWTVPCDFRMHGSAPAVANGTVYLAGTGGEIVALDLATRQERWRTKLKSATSSSPVVSGETLYIGADDDRLYALDVADGSERWRVRTGPGADYAYCPSPAVADGMAYYASALPESKHGLVAIDAASGMKRWQFKPDLPGLFTPVVAGDTVFVGGHGGTAYAVDRATGEPRWKATVGSIWSAPAVTRDLVIVQVSKGMLVGLDRETGETAWSVHTGAEAEPVVAGDTVYVSSPFAQEEGLYAVDARSGLLRWHIGAFDAITAPVAVSGGTLVGVADHSVVYGFTGSRGDLVERGTDGKGTYLSPIVFSTDINELGVPADPAERFPEGTGQLVASYHYIGMQEGVPWKVEWSFNGELAVSEGEWDGELVGMGWHRLTADDGELPVGRYQVEIWYDGALIRRSACVIG